MPFKECFLCAPVSRREKRTGVAQGSASGSHTSPGDYGSDFRNFSHFRREVVATRPQRVQSVFHNTTWTWTWETHTCRCACACPCVHPRRGPALGYQDVAISRFRPRAH
eukprot:4695540-Prymnesium_polylepis.2